MSLCPSRHWETLPVWSWPAADFPPQHVTVPLRRTTGVCQVPAWPLASGVTWGGSPWAAELVPQLRAPPARPLPLPDTAQEAMEGTAFVPVTPWGHGHGTRTSIPNPGRGHSSDGHASQGSASRFLLPASMWRDREDRLGQVGQPRLRTVRAGLRQRGAEGVGVPHSLSDGTTSAALPWRQSWLTPNPATAALAGIRSKWAQADWGRAGGWGHWSLWAASG